MPAWYQDRRRRTEVRLASRRQSHGILGLFLAPLGQMNPQHCPYQECRVSERCPAEPLGQPMNIRQVAALLGCSVWTVRQRYLPIGLPYFRIGRAGKLMFYRNQIIRWILEKQARKGGEI